MELLNEGASQASVGGQALPVLTAMNTASLLSFLPQVRHLQAECSEGR